MEAVLTAAEDVLRHSGLPALRLSRLLREVKSAVGSNTRNLDAETLRSMLEGHPQRFRVLDPWRGPWRFVRTAERNQDGEPWVVAVRDGGDGSARDEGIPRVVRQVQESVRWLALSLDAESPLSVTRWKGLLLEALAAHDELERAA